MATRRVKFIGRTAHKRDNVCQSNLFWKYRGAIQVAPEDIAIRLFTHSDVWVEADDDDNGSPMTKGIKIKLDEGMSRDDRVNLVIKIINDDDCLLEVMSHFGDESIILSGDDAVDHQANYDRLVKLEADALLPDSDQGAGDDATGDGTDNVKGLADVGEPGVGDVVAFSPVREDAIIQAIEALDRDNEEHFTKEGIPRVEAIEGLLNYEVSASERTAAWDTIQEGEGE